MHDSDAILSCSGRTLRIALALAAMLALGAADAPDSAPIVTPQVVGDGESADLVRAALAQTRDRATAEVWEQRAFDALRRDGWMWARVRARAPEQVSGRWKIELDPGPRARITELEVRGPEVELAQRWREASGLRVGGVLRPREWERRVTTGLRVLGERGHPFASATVVRQESDPATGAVRLVMMVRAGEIATLGTVHIEGATHTRPEVLARLSGLKPGDRVRESALAQARSRLESRPALVQEVESIELQRSGGDRVDVHVRVRQPATTGRLAAAVGAVRGDDERTRLSGSIDLALLDLFGTARRFEGRWSDDGGARRRLDLAYLEPGVFGTPLDLGLDLGQRHEDDAYDTFRAGLRANLTASAGRELALSLGFDRTTFLGEQGRVRWRQRIGAGIGLERRRPVGSGGYGRMRSSVEAARVRDTRVEVGGTVRVEASVTQTLLEFEGQIGQAFTSLIAAQLHLNWRSTETDALPLPRSELWALGGATTVRGYEEERFLGERIAWSGAELVLGPARGGQAYAFVDAGWVQSTTEVEERRSKRERWLSGFGLGVRSPTALGAIDLSLGFAERVGLDAGKLHLVLARTF